MPKKEEVIQEDSEAPRTSAMGKMFLFVFFGIVSVFLIYLVVSTTSKDNYTGLVYTGGTSGDSSFLQRLINLFSGKEQTQQYSASQITREPIAEKEGTYIERISEDFSEQDNTPTLINQESLLIADDGTEYSLQFVDKSVKEELTSGNRIKVRGKQQGNTITNAKAEDLSIQRSSSITGMAASGGSTKILAIMGNLPDMQVGCSVDQVKNILFSRLEGARSVRNAYNYVSYGKMDITGDVAGTAAISNCKDFATLDSFAQSQGYSASGYNKIIYVTPSKCISWGGIREKKLQVSSCGSVFVFTHELGHAFGMYHANRYDDSTGTTIEYGDNTDFMGTGCIGCLNAPHRNQMGWLPSGKVVKPASNSMHNLAPLEIKNPTATTLPLALQMPNNFLRSTYYVSYHYGDSIANPILSGMSRSGTTTLYDQPRQNSFTSLEASFGDGQTFEDPNNGYTFKQISHDQNKGVVQVAFGAANPCYPWYPEVSAKTDQGWDSAAVHPGIKVDYTISIKNWDTDCDPATFTVTPTNVDPALIWEFVSGPSVTVPSLGTGNVVLRVWSSPTQADGMYDFYLHVTSPASDKHDITHYNTGYEVDTIPPLPPVISADNQGGINIRWDFVLDGSLYKVYRDGTYIGDGKKEDYNSYIYSDKSAKQGSTYRYYVEAIDGAGNKAQSNTLTVTR